MNKLTLKSGSVVIQENTAELIRGSVSENTLRAYNRCLDELSVWAAGQELSDEKLSDYLSVLHDAGKAPSTIAQVVAAVKWRYKFSQVELSLPLTDSTLAGIRRAGRDRGRGQVQGLTWQQVERVCSFAEADNTIAGLRDSAMIRLMSDGLLRVSEVSSVNWGDLKESTLHLRSSKTDQEGVGCSLYVCDGTRDVLYEYKTAADLSKGACFRRIRRGDKVTSQRLIPNSIRRIIVARATAAGVKGFISGHSLRVGSAVSLAKAGATVVDMQVAGRWKSAQMPAHYAAAELAERGAIARFKDGK